MSITFKLAAIALASAMISSTSGVPEEVADARAGLVLEAGCGVCNSRLLSGDDWEHSFASGSSELCDTEAEVEENDDCMSCDPYSCHTVWVGFKRDDLDPPLHEDCDIVDRENELALLAAIDKRDVAEAARLIAANPEALSWNSARQAVQTLLTCGAVHHHHSGHRTRRTARCHPDAAATAALTATQVRVSAVLALPSTTGS